MVKITITGDLASGKSSVAKMIAEKLPAKYFSTGQLQRKMADEMGMTTLELNQYSETHPEIDNKIDNQVKALSDEASNLIVDSRMAWHFLPNSFKIYLSVDDFIAADRVMADDQRIGEPKYTGHIDALHKLRERKNSENRRYLSLYNADCGDMSHFDIVVDTSFSSPKTTMIMVLNLLNNWSEGVVERYWLSPNLLYPMKAVHPLISDNAVRLQRSLSDQGFDQQYAISVIKVGRRYFIWDGHKRVCAAIKNKLSHVPVVVVAQDNEAVIPGLSAIQQVHHSFNKSRLHDWENALGITYLVKKQTTD